MSYDVLYFWYEYTSWVSLDHKIHPAFLDAQPFPVIVKLKGVLFHLYINSGEIFIYFQ